MWEGIVEPLLKKYTIELKKEILSEKKDVDMLLLQALASL
jgi:predicted DNA-binding protein (UPF0278 family)